MRARRTRTGSAGSGTTATTTTSSCWSRRASALRTRTRSRSGDRSSASRRWRPLKTTIGSTPVRRYPRPPGPHPPSSASHESAGSPAAGRRPVPARVNRSTPGGRRRHPSDPIRAGSDRRRDRFYRKLAARVDGHRAVGRSDDRLRAARGHGRAVGQRTADLAPEVRPLGDAGGLFRRREVSARDEHGGHRERKGRVGAPARPDRRVRSLDVSAGARRGARGAHGGAGGIIHAERVGNVLLLRAGRRPIGPHEQRAPRHPGGRPRLDGAGAAVSGRGAAVTEVRARLVIVALAMLAAACESPSTPEARPQPGGRPAASADVKPAIVSPEYRTRQRTIETTGKVQFNEESLVRVHAPATGRVLEVFARPGDVLEPGARLFVLDSADLGAAKADYAKAVADLERSTAAARLSRELFDAQVVAQKELREAEND